MMVLHEWGSKYWDRHSEIKALVGNEIIAAMSNTGVSVFALGRLTRVFRGVDSSNFSGIANAIEKRISAYDDEEEEEEGQEQVDREDVAP
jgi:hypothetical protein